MDPDDPKDTRGPFRTMHAAPVLDVAKTAYSRRVAPGVSVSTICHMADISKPRLDRVFDNEDGLTRAGPDTLIDFAWAGPRMETGSLCYKMRAGRPRLGPETCARPDEIDTAALAGCAAVLKPSRDAGDRPQCFSAPAWP
jgi:hypothetical protein